MTVFFVLTAVRTSNSTYLTNKFINTCINNLIIKLTSSLRRILTLPLLSILTSNLREPHLMFSFHPRLAFPRDFLTRILFACIVSPIRAAYLLHRNLLHIPTLTTRCGLDKSQNFLCNILNWMFSSLRVTEPQRYWHFKCLNSLETLRNLQTKIDSNQGDSPWWRRQ
jgi:hypothetical protein